MTIEVVKLMAIEVVIKLKSFRKLIKLVQDNKNAA